MNIFYAYRKSHFILGGVILTLLSGFTIIWLLISFYYNVYPHYVQSNVLNNPASLIWPSFIGLGIYFIIKGTFHYEFQFSETNFKFFKNSRLKIDVPVEEINGIYITHKVSYDGYGGEYEYKIIEIEIGGKFEVRLTIRGKRWISRFLFFAGLLKIYCSKKQIHFNPRKNDVKWRGFKWGYLQDNTFLKDVQDDNFLAWYPDMLKF